VGVQFGSDTEKLMLFDILNERYERRRPTILMSNLPRDEVSAYLGERVFDRLREDGGQFISFTWESYRKSRNQQGEIA
jgi:DNA replication protein DnaC